MKYYLFVLGCQMNKSDSERIAAVLEEAGYKKTDQENQADLICVVSCSVRQSAIDRIYGFIRKIRNPKQEIRDRLQNRNTKLQTKRPILILTGCLLEEDKKNLQELFDLIFDIRDLGELPNKLASLYIYRCVDKDRGVIDKRWRDCFDILPKYSSKFTAFIPIMTGCDNFCTYCAVPYTRGREVSRPEKEILAEVKNLIKKGYKEIILLGQNVNSYKNVKTQISNTKKKVAPRLRSETKSDFVRLLEKINAIPGRFWIRFVTSHPKDMGQDLIWAIANLEKITEYIHLPAQSGSNAILKKMNRHYTAKQYLDLLGRIHENVFKIKGERPAISTDIIVGFPGETKKQFRETKELMEKAQFDMAYIAQYSPRSGTLAARVYKDNVPKSEKRRREEELVGILKKTAFVHNKKYLGKSVEVLVEGFKKGFFFGKTRTFKTVKFKAKNKKSLVGSFVLIKITKAREFGLEGNLIKKTPAKQGLGSHLDIKF